MSTVEIEIDGKRLTAKPNDMIIQVADAAGIYIPRFCYHKHLSIAANCRMCLVEVEKSPKTLPACATPVTAGMKVLTKSPKAIEAQRAVMAFLLINHPLDCPVCDQGGECELQDLSMGYGSSHSYYQESKRAIADQNIGPLISTEMTRCIYCTRCVRFGEEIAGMREMGGTYRGENTEIGTFVQHAIQSEVSGNIIDLCPVGALTSKPFRFTARAWELDQALGVSPHDCLGTNLHVHTRYGTVMRIVSRENAAINETWIADRDRYSYTALYHPERLKEPMAKIEGQWRTVDWQQAFEIAAMGLQEAMAAYGSDKLGALAASSSTLEEFYLLQKMIRGLGSPHIDHRLREMDTRDQDQLGAFPGLGMPLSELEQCDAIILIGSNIQKEQPLAALRIRKATLNHAVVMVINPVDYAFNFSVREKKIVAPHHLPDVLTDLLEKADQLKTKFLSNRKKISIILGAFAMHHPQAAVIRTLARQLAEKMGAQLSVMTEGANSAGGWVAGAVPHRQADGMAVKQAGLNAYEMLQKPRKAYVLLNVEPELDGANPALMRQALKQADFILALSVYRHPLLEDYAHVILPMTAFTETSGTFINAAGTWQSFKGVAKPYHTSRPAWKILRVLGNFLHLAGFEYESSEEIKQEIIVLREKASTTIQIEKRNIPLIKEKSTLSRIGEIPIYAVDSLVRRAQPLQEAQAIVEGDIAVVRLHPDTAKKLNVQAGQKVVVKQQANQVILPLVIDERIAIDAAWLAGGIVATAELGDLLGEVEITC